MPALTLPRTYAVDALARIAKTKQDTARKMRLIAERYRAEAADPETPTYCAAQLLRLAAWVDQDADDQDHEAIRLTNPHA